MPDEIFFLVLLFFGIVFFLFVVPVIMIVKINRLLQGREEDSSRFRSQLRNLQDEMKRIREQIGHLSEHFGIKPKEEAEKKAPPTVAPVVPAVPPPLAAPATPSVYTIDDIVLPPLPEVETAPSVPLFVAPPLAAASKIAPEESSIVAELLPERPIAKPAPAFGQRVPEIPPRQPSRFETAAVEILKKMWNWFVVGDEFRRPGVSLEFAVASTWLIRITVVLLFMAVAFFLNYTIERDILSPSGRVAMAMLTGAILLGSGLYILHSKYRPLGMGLIGGGIATFYASIFAAFHFYRLIDQVPAFGLMILVTLCSGVLAVKLRSQLIAILGILGGYGTPIMLSTGVVDFVGLFSYMLLLGVGVLGISLGKKWHLLNYLAFVCNYILFFGAMTRYKNENFMEVMPFLAGFFVLFSTLAFFHNLVRRVKSTLLEPIGLLVNAGVFFGTSYYIVDEIYGSRGVSIVALSLAAFYAAHVWLYLVHKNADRELWITFLGLAALFLTITVPLLLSRDWITVTWAVQALLLLWMAGKLKSEFLRHASYVVYAIVLVRLGFCDLFHRYFEQGMLSADAIPMTDYLRLMLDRAIAVGIPIASLACAAKLLRLQKDVFPPKENASRDIPTLLPENAATFCGFGLALGILFLFLNLEIYHSAYYFFRPIQLPMLSILWIALAAFFFARFLAGKNRSWLTPLVLTGIVVGAKVFIVDLPSWNLLTDYFRYDGDYSFLDAGMRLIDFGAVIGFFTYVAMLLSRDGDTKQESRSFAAAAIVFLFIFLTLEVSSFFHFFALGFQAWAVSILWGIFALGMLVPGIVKKIAALRYTALPLLAVVTVKVLFFDLADSDQIYRIIAIFITAIVMLLASIAYIRFEQKLHDETYNPTEDKP